MAGKSIWKILLIVAGGGVAILIVFFIVGYFLFYAAHVKLQNLGSVPIDRITCSIYGGQSLLKTKGIVRAGVNTTIWYDPASENYPPMQVTVYTRQGDTTFEAPSHGAAIIEVFDGPRVVVIGK